MIHASSDGLVGDEKIVNLKREIKALQTENLRLRDALERAHQIVQQAYSPEVTEAEWSAVENILCPKNQRKAKR